MNNDLKIPAAIENDKAKIINFCNTAFYLPESPVIIIIIFTPSHLIPVVPRLGSHSSSLN